MTPWSCAMCGADGVRNIGTRGYCSVHLEELLATFDRSVFAFAGVGLQEGPLRVDWGPNYADLRCNACEATWVGVPGDACQWCVRAYRLMIEHQAELVLTPPDTDPQDVRYLEAVDAWTGRLRVAIEAGIIDERDAERVTRRAATRAA